MRFKLPKPLHGWREFAGEVGIIVIGVLIALGAEQMVEDWNWQSKTRTAVSDLRAESENNFSLMAERVTVGPCVDVQLDRLMTYVLSDSETRSKPIAPIKTEDLGEVAFRQPVDRPFQDDVWRSLLTDGSTSHLDRDGRQRMAQFYWQIESMRDLQKKGDAAVGELNLLLSSFPLDPSTRGSLATTIARQRFIGTVLTTDATQGLAMLQSVGQNPEPQVVDAFLNTSGSINYCRKQHLPLADWRARLASETQSEAGFGGARLGKYPSYTLMPRSKF